MAIILNDMDGCVLNYWKISCYINFKPSEFLFWKIFLYSLKNNYTERTQGATFTHT